FALIIQSADANQQDDVFDLCYVDFFSSDAAKDYLAFLDSQAEKRIDEPARRHHLRTGLIHAGRMILLPKFAFEQHHENWAAGFDFNRFRSEMHDAVDEFQQSGDTSASLLHQMDKIRQRIDQDQDGKCSDKEIESFLWQKMRVLQLGT